MQIPTTGAKVLRNGRGGGKLRVGGGRPLQVVISARDPEARPDGRLLKAARALGVDRVTAEVVTAMDRAGIPTILLKGPSIARWLYPDGGRTYIDTDLLVPSHQFRRAETLLRSLGFRQMFEGFHAAERSPDAVATAFVREGSDKAGREGQVDLHRSLPGLPAPDNVLWDTLRVRCETISLGGVDVRVLDRVGVALHIVVHAVQHGYEFHTDEDLRRALDALTTEEWRDVAALAQPLGIDDVVGFALRRHPKGVEVAERLRLPCLSLADSAYFWSCSHAPRGSQSLSLMCSAPTLRDKVRIVRWAVVPSPAKVRYLSGVTHFRGRSLALAYLEHWQSVVRDLGPAARFVLTQRAGAGRGSEAR